MKYPKQFIKLLASILTILMLFGSMPVIAETTDPIILVSTDPEDNEVDVPTDKVITLTFDREITAGVDIGNISITDGQSVTDYVYAIEDNVLSLMPAAPLAEGTSYIVTVPIGAVEDQDNNTLEQDEVFSFITVAADDLLLLVSTDPADNAVDVPTDKVISLTFNKDIIAGEDIEDISITDGQSVTDYVYGIEDNILTLTPVNPLAEDTVYTVTIPAGAVEDQDHNTLEQDEVFSFTTIQAIPVGTTYQYTYDANNRIQYVEISTGITLEYQYDANGNLIKIQNITE